MNGKAKHNKAYCQFSGKLNQMKLNSLSFHFFDFFLWFWGRYASQKGFPFFKGLPRYFIFTVSPRYGRIYISLYCFLLKKIHIFQVLQNTSNYNSSDCSWFLTVQGTQSMSPYSWEKSIKYPVLFMVHTSKEKLLIPKFNFILYPKNQHLSYKLFSFQ